MISLQCAVLSWDQDWGHIACVNYFHPRRGSCCPMLTVSRCIFVTGTFISAFTVLCGARTDLPDRHICCVFWLNIAAAFIQIVTAIVMVGWIMSIFWGMDMVILASEYSPIIPRQALLSLNIKIFNSFGCFGSPTKNPSGPTKSLVLHNLCVFESFSTMTLILRSTFSHRGHLRDSYATITEGSNAHWCSRMIKHALRNLLNRMKMCTFFLLCLNIIFFSFSTPL